jgi:hypothetical protein
MGGGHSLNARSDLTIALFVLKPLLWECPCLGLYLRCKAPRRNIWATICNRSEERGGTLHLLIGITIILNLRSRCKTPPPPPTPCDPHMFWFKLPFALCFTMGHSQNVDKLRFWEPNYRPFCISHFILFYFNFFVHGINLKNFKNLNLSIINFNVKFIPPGYQFVQIFG